MGGAIPDVDVDTTEDFPRIRGQIEKYRDLPADFTDALCERLKITSVASVDKDFTIYCTRDRKTFQNLFPRESP